MSSEYTIRVRGRLSPDILAALGTPGAANTATETECRVVPDQASREWIIV